MPPPSTDDAMTKYFPLELDATLGYVAMLGAASIGEHSHSMLPARTTRDVDMSTTCGGAVRRGVITRNTLLRSYTCI